MNPDLFEELILRAIEQEIAARDFYAEAARRVQGAHVKEIFLEMSRQEEKHRETLETFRFDPTARVAFARVEDFGVAEESSALPLTFDLSPRDAFQLAMKKEQAAMETYLKWARVCQNAELKRVYEELAEMERGHKARIEELFVNAAFPEAW